MENGSCAYVALLRNWSLSRGERCTRVASVQVSFAAKAPLERPNSCGCASRASPAWQSAATCRLCSPKRSSLMPGTAWPNPSAPEPLSSTLSLYPAINEIRGRHST